MKKLILPVTLIAMALLETACSGDKKDATPTATQNACWSSAGQNQAACQQVYQSAAANATALAEVPSGQSKLNAVLGTSSPAVAKAEVGVASLTPASVAQASDAAIKAQSVKIQSALANYASNPDSSYYDPATSRTVASTKAATDIAPASVVASAPVTPSVVESSLAEASVPTPASSNSGSAR